MRARLVRLTGNTAAVPVASGPMARLAAMMDDAAKEAFAADLARVVAGHRRHDGIAFRAAAWLVGSRA